MFSTREILAEIIYRKEASEKLLSYITFINKTYKVSNFSRRVCAELDQFLIDVSMGKRPILVLQAPPQHGKSEIVSRCLPAFLFGRFPNYRIGAVSYGAQLANRMAQDVRRNIIGKEHELLFPIKQNRGKYDRDTISEFSNPNGKGSYIAVGVGAALVGFPLDIGIIDDPIKNEQEALSEATKERHWSWYQTVFNTRFSERSGQIIMATAWAEDDLPSRIIKEYEGSERMKVLRFPAINEEGEALVPELHSIEKLLETRKLFSEYWWSAVYQQNPRAIGGNVFVDKGIQYWNKHELPPKFDKVIASWDCAFKDAKSSDFVVGQVWGKIGSSAYLLYQVRDRLSFTKTVDAVLELKERFPEIRATLIEDKANGPAVIDTIRKRVPGILPIEPDGSKLARAHAITSYWEAQNIFIPHHSVHQWVKDFVNEITMFPAASHDDQVDSMTQAIRYLFPLRNQINIVQAALDKINKEGASNTLFRTTGRIVQ
jgi:predicted phage terminase large subunit-like protein